jgi:hypothetical protein
LAPHASQMSMLSRASLLAIVARLIGFWDFLVGARDS